MGITLRSGTEGKKFANRKIKVGNTRMDWGAIGGIHQHSASLTSRPNPVVMRHKKPLKTEKSREFLSMILPLMSEHVPSEGLKLGLRAPDKFLCDTAASYSLSKHRELVLL